VQLHVFLISTLDSCEMSASLLARFISGEGAYCMYPSSRTLGRLHKSCLDALKKVKISFHFRESNKIFVSPNRPGLVIMHADYFNTCNVHLLLFCTMNNKRTIISQIITLLHVSTLSCHPQGACNQYLAKLHKYFKRNSW
jgi:hypothetical protein